MAQSTEIAGVKEGDVLAGKYRVERVLGVGGMGVVVAARHIHLDDKVAIKFLLPEMLESPEAVGRFIREARAAVRIKNEHVARVTDVGTLDNGAPYMVMEYLDGGDLAAWIEKRGALPAEQAVDFVLQACEAIADAHGLGIVHRDLKPANLFCIRRSDGQFSIKVLDFGISKVTGPAGSGTGMGMTKTSAVMGSPLYMSPEQMQSSREVDSRTDLWSIGIILFELISARSPFIGASLPEVCVNIATQPVPPLRSFAPAAPLGLEKIILKCLEKDRERRYRNVAELAVALVEFGPKSARASAERISGIIQGAGLSVSGLTLQATSLPTTGSGAVATAASWGQTAPPAKANQGRVMLGVGAAIFLAAGMGAVFLLRRPAEPPVTTAGATVVATAPAGVTPSPSPVVTPPPPVANQMSPEPVPAPAPEPAASTIKAAPPLQAAAKPDAGSVARPPKPPPVPVNVTKPPPAPPARPSAQPADLGGRL